MATRNGTFIASFADKRYFSDKEFTYKIFIDPHPNKTFFHHIDKSELAVGIDIIESLQIR